MALHARALLALCCLALAVSTCHGRLLLNSTADAGVQPVVVMAHPVQLKGPNATLAAPPTQAMHDAVCARVLDELPTIWDKLNRVISDFCFLNSGTGCEVDTNATTDWFTGWFPDLTALQVTSGCSQVYMQGDPTVTQTSTHAFRCDYDPVQPKTCTLSGQAVASTSTTRSSSKSFSFQSKVGSLSKIKAGLTETQLEFTFDFGYSFSDGTSDTKLEGGSTLASVSVPMTPDDQSCAVISVVVQSVKQTGSISAYVTVTGWVGTSQNDNHHWPFVDGNADEQHHIRALWFPWLIQLAKQNNQASAAEWNVGFDGSAFINVPITVDFDLVVSAYADPEKYPTSDPMCSS